MRDPSRTRVSGPLEPYAEGFRGDLAGRGYSPGAAAVQLLVMGHLSGWLAGRGLDSTGLTPALVDAYLAERRSLGCASHWTRRGLAPLLGFLRGREVVPAETTPGPAGPVEALLVRPFLAGRDTGGGVALEHLRVADVTAFVVARCRDARGGTAPRMVGALRSLLGFLHVEGLIDQPLAAVVPSVAGWKLAGVPKALDDGQVAALLASCDRHTAVGRRDLAILTVLVRLGLRASEAAALRLDDIDWRRGVITVHGKGNRQDQLPLPADVGQAIVAWLTAGRPDTTAAGGGREVFVRVRAPRQVLTRGAVTQVVARAGQRAGLGPIHAHRLRHTAATGMLRAGGSLGEIGQVLRHRHALTTAIYAKVDIDGLRPLARRWPTGAR